MEITPTRQPEECFGLHYVSTTFDEVWTSLIGVHICGMYTSKWRRELEGELSWLCACPVFGWRDVNLRALDPEGNRGLLPPDRGWLNSHSKGSIVRQEIRSSLRTSSTNDLVLGYNTVTNANRDIGQQTW